MPRQPRFINSQNFRVGVVTPERKKVYVEPFSGLKDAPADSKRVFVLEGEHYAKFAGPGGPLSHFPDTESTVVAAPAVVAVTGVVSSGEAPHPPADDTAGAGGVGDNAGDSATAAPTGDAPPADLGTGVAGGGTSGAEVTDPAAGAGDGKETDLAGKEGNESEGKDVPKDPPAATGMRGKLSGKRNR